MKEESTMTKDSQTTPPGTPPQLTQATKTSHPRTTQSASNSPFSSIGRAAKAAVKPTRTLKSRSVGHGLAAIYIEQGNIASLGNQGQSSAPEHDAEDKSIPSPRNRKRDFIPNLIRSLIPEPKGKPQRESPKAHIRRHSTDSTHNSDIPFPSVGTNKTIGIERAVASTVIKDWDPNVQPPALSTKPRTDVFSHNVSAPAFRISLPKLYARVNSTPQLALCIGLLRAESDTASTHEAICSYVTSTDTAAQRDWVNAIRQDPTEQNQMRSLGASMVEEFSKDALKDSVKVAELVLLGPVLDRETFRDLLEATITAFVQCVLLDVDLLQGLVQLVQFAPAESLLPDDLVKILRILRFRLQDTHQQSLEHAFYITLAVSKLLDVMAEHNVEDLDRVMEHEPLSGILLGLRGSSDPFLMYQACYAFQALQYVYDDETPLQALFRHSTGVVGRLVKVTDVLKLDLDAVLLGLDKLQATIVSAADGPCSLMESGRKVFESLRQGFDSEQKKPWYAAILAANALARAGQLKDLNQLICEAPCRQDPLFQWGICQLLGEIASDAIWETPARLQAVELLEELNRNDSEWGQDKSVQAWMLNITYQLGNVDEHAVSTSAHMLLKGMLHKQGTAARLTYPLRNRLLLPSSSPVLTHVLDIPDVKFDLHRLRQQRLNECKGGIYISPMAKPGLKAKDDDVFPLLEKVLEFLSSKRQVMLVLGDSGAGKSAFNRHLEHRLWTDYKQGDSIPLYINLPDIDRPDQDMIAKQLKFHNFSDEQIQELKLYHHFIIICDGYDESQQLVNLHRKNSLNRPRQWDTKMIVSCRTQFLGPTYFDRFNPQSDDRYPSGSQDLFQEAVIAPFSKDQIKNYLEKYVEDPASALLFQNKPVWSVQEYTDKLTNIPNLMDLAKNPFLLTLTLKALPGLAASHKDLASIRITRAVLYDMFVDQWLDISKHRLETNTLTPEELEAFGALVNSGFTRCGIDYLRRLADAVFEEQDGNPVIQYVHLRDKYTWKADFFGTDPQIKLLRESCPLTRAGNQHRFFHRSILEYCFSCVIYTPAWIGTSFDPQEDMETFAFRVLGADSPLFERNLLNEPSIIQFLCDRVKVHPDFEQQLRDVIEQSKTDSSAAVAATNAITILVKAGVTFHGADLRGVKIHGADLSDGQFDSVQFQGADLSGVNFSRSWLRQVDLSDAQLESAQFGELPYFSEGSFVEACAYSPDGKLFGAALWDGSIAIYDTTTWTRVHYIQGDGKVRDIQFSPDNKRWVSSNGYTVGVWDCASGKGVLVMIAHMHNLNSMMFSPCGMRIVSASQDKTVRLWDAQTGECLFVLVGHTWSVTCVKFSPDGRELVSVSLDETIRFWDPETGKAGVVLSPSFDEVHSVAYSSDGRWVASGHKAGALQLWSTATKELGPLLRGHTGAVTSIAFSPDGQWIASSSEDQTVRLWDASTGILMSILTAHKKDVFDVVFSPDGSQLASGGVDKKVRLWDVRSCLSSVEVQGQISHVLKMGYSLDGQALLSHGGRIVRQWDPMTGVGGSVSVEFPDVLSIGTKEFPPDGNQFTNGSRDRDVRKYNRGIGGDITVGWAKRVDVIAYSPCCQWLAFSDWENIVRLWDIQDPEQFHVLLDVKRAVNNTIGSVAFSRTGLLLAIGSWNGTVWVFDTQSRELLKSRRLIRGRVLVATFSPNGQQLALGSDSSIYLWDLQSKTPRIKLQGHSAITISLSYSPCGQWLVSGSEDKMARLWHQQQPFGEKEHWSCVSVLGGFFGAVHDVVWNPVIAMEFVTACKDGSIRAWRVSSDVEGDGGVVVKLLWGSNLRMLCASDLVFKDAVGLCPIQQKLLVQRGAVSSDPTHTPFFEGDEADESLSSADDDASDESISTSERREQQKRAPVVQRIRTPRIMITKDSESERSSSSDEVDSEKEGEDEVSSSSSEGEEDEEEKQCRQM
ncbi:hypothetical protein KI688_004049 [Linnemannia hyalina]|uniref:WD40 repeat-like protein n=1 Tax=Linnemannia hyalina TaxID=64524 RepID=A0A9P7XMH9_9FUNG|nr:hypothetical protein KI688_004049 [Linnemannia hyalina]